MEATKGVKRAAVVAVMAALGACTTARGLKQETAS